MKIYIPKIVQTTRLWNNLVVLPNKFAFEEYKLINLGMVVSMTVFFYLPQQIWIFFCLSLELELFPFDCSETHWDIDSAQ